MYTAIKTKISVPICAATENLLTDALIAKTTAAPAIVQRAETRTKMKNFAAFNWKPAIFTIIIHHRHHMGL